MVLSSRIYRGTSYLDTNLHKDTYSKVRLAVFTNYPSITKDQALDETVLTLFHHMVHAAFNSVVGVRIQSPIMVKG